MRTISSCHFIILFHISFFHRQSGALASVNLNDVSIGSSQIKNNRAGAEGGGFFVGTSSVLRLFWTTLWQGNVCVPKSPGKILLYAC